METTFSHILNRILRPSAVAAYRLDNSSGGDQFVNLSTEASSIGSAADTPLFGTAATMSANDEFYISDGKPMKEMYVNIITPGVFVAAGIFIYDSDNGGTGGVNGGNSVFSTITAIGGGGGGGHYAVQQGVQWDAPANVGGSGGGGSNGSAGAAGSAGQGNAGGTVASGGSGGGAGGTGGNGDNTLPRVMLGGGAGGIGAASTITGVSVSLAKGGSSSGTPTAGVVGLAGAANTGNGGGGSTRGGSNGRTANTSPGGAGGSGIVIVRYIYQSIDTPIFANNAVAVAGSLTLGQLYRTGADPDLLCVVH